MSKDILKKVMQEPDAPQIIERLETLLQQERAKRRDFYNNLNDERKAEFINGEIIVHSPVKKEHNDALFNLTLLLSNYVRRNKLGYVGIEKLMVSFSRNDYEPDLVFFGPEKAENFARGQVLFPVPDFIIEIISSKTEARDRGIKYLDYQNHKVKEYWMVDPGKHSLEQYILRREKFVLNHKSTDGNVTSRVVKGFRIPVAAIFDEDKNQAALEDLIRMG